VLTFMPYLLSVGIEIATELRGYSHVSGHKKSPGRLGLGRIFRRLHHPFAAFAFAFAHRARCAAAIFLRAATDILRLSGIATTFALFPFALAFAHRAF
jgi:hypothetical protein